MQKLCVKLNKNGVLRLCRFREARQNRSGGGYENEKEDLRGAKLMIVQPVDNFLKDNGDEMVAIDTVGAGSG